MRITLAFAPPWRLPERADGGGDRGGTSASVLAVTIEENVEALRPWSAWSTSAWSKTSASTSSGSSSLSM